MNNKINDNIMPVIFYSYLVMLNCIGYLGLTKFDAGGFKIR